ncbi:ATP-binding protein [Sphingomonas sp.]|uniref:sensor histidine kinase n=1 Tax=Sphingomonas sp. TaxID=28214 RepID=UPI0025D23BB7|nr:ATP-binding protein [Sphingomonas sp.]MBV9527601.1 HAMP domain-containing protein [Sphingomonas sp.]
MPSWRSSAAYRIAFANFAAYAIGIALLGAVIVAVIHAAFARQLDSMVSDEAATLAAEYRVGGASELSETLAERGSRPSSSRMLYALFDAHGRRIGGSLVVNRPRPGLHEITFIDPKEGPDAARAMTLDIAPDRRIVVAVDSDWSERFERIVIIVFGVAFLGFCLLGFGGAVILARYLERRLRSISGSAQAIIGGDIRQRMPVSPRHDEFDQLAITLNRMLNRIEGLLDNLRQVSGDIAHDLRTPLARLRARLEQGCVGDHDARAIIEDAITQVDEVLSLFAAILRIAEIESGETRRFFKPVDLSALTTELAESFAPSVEDEGRNLLWSVEPGISRPGDRELLAQAVINLLENAQRHTPPGTIIRLSLVDAGDIACLSVVDSGPGVPRAEFARVTKRFSRLQASRNTAGHGLGLSLVNGVAHLHSGKLVLRDAEPGLSATLELPLGDIPDMNPDQEKENAR